MDMETEGWHRPRLMDGLDGNVIESLDAYFEHGLDGGSFVNALLAQDAKLCMEKAHQSLSRLSILQHLEYTRLRIVKAEKDWQNQTLEKLQLLVGVANASKEYSTELTLHDWSELILAIETLKSESKLWRTRWQQLDCNHKERLCRIASMCGNPNAAEACRLILKEIEEVTND